MRNCEVCDGSGKVIITHYNALRDLSIDELHGHTRSLFAVKHPTEKAATPCPDCDGVGVVMELADEWAVEAARANGSEIFLTFACFKCHGSGHCETMRSLVTRATSSRRWPYDGPNVEEHAVCDVCNGAGERAFHPPGRRMGLR
jgi:DnaJ-class molecular chaperone